MTPDTLGPCPPDGFTTTRACTQDRIPDVPVVSARYADYWRRRAERAEELLREAMVSRIHTMTCATHKFKPCNCDLWSGRVAAHFDQVKP